MQGLPLPVPTDYLMIMVSEWKTEFDEFCSELIKKPELDDRFWLS